MFSRLVASRPNRSGAVPLKAVVGVVSVLALLAIVTAIVKIDKHKWELPHTLAQTFLSNRPECPENWAGFPLWPDSMVAYYIKSPTPDRHFTIVNGVVVYQPANAELPLSGPQTNIPEFNDCQKLLSTTDPSRFDSLSAIFVAYKVDSVTAGLGWHTLTWTSSNATVATVDATGLVTAVALGTAVIKAQSVSNSNLSKSVQVTVGVGPPAPSPAPPIFLGGAPPGPMTVGTARYAIAEFGNETAIPSAVATIYNYGPGYASLGIGPNFNCLYLFFDNTNTLRAKMVRVNVLSAPGTLCTDPVTLDGPNVTDLDVRRTVVNVPGQNPATLYPPVARWDYDPLSEKQYIGLACGEAWCEVFEKTFAPSSPTPVASSAASAEQRVLYVKGWHDQQILAVSKDPGSDPVPSNLLGTVIPNPELKSQPWSKTGPYEWHLAAYITLQDLKGDALDDFEKYDEKLNVKETPLGTPLEKANRISYCYGPKKVCVPDAELLVNECDNLIERVFYNVHRWWVRIDAAGGESKIFCLTRRSHPGYNFQIPPTARWRWILRDDSMWTECVNGCCQTGGS